MSFIKYYVFQSVFAHQCTQGVWVEEVHQSFTDWITQVVRVYKGIPGVEFAYTVGPIPVKYDMN